MHFVDTIDIIRLIWVHLIKINTFNKQGYEKLLVQKFTTGEFHYTLFV